MNGNAALFWPELRIDPHEWIPSVPIMLKMCSSASKIYLRSAHEDIKGTIVLDGSTSSPLEIRSGVKQRCVLAPTLFAIFFVILPKHALEYATEGVYLRYRSDGKLFKLSRLTAKSIRKTSAIFCYPWRSSHQPLRWRPPTVHEPLQ